MQKKEKQLQEDTLHKCVYIKNVVPGAFLCAVHMFFLPVWVFSGYPMFSFYSPQACKLDLSVALYQTGDLSWVALASLYLQSWWISGIDNWYWILIDILSRYNQDGSVAQQVGSRVLRLVSMWCFTCSPTVQKHAYV